MVAILLCKIHALTQAVICAILAQAGPQVSSRYFESPISNPSFIIYDLIFLILFPLFKRSRMLNTLYKDERVHQQCSSLIQSMLDHVHLGRLLKPTMVKEFAKSLLEHQLATTADGRLISILLFV